MPDHPDHKERRREVRLRVPVGARLVRFLMHPAGKCLAGVAVVAAVAGLGVFTYYYDHYSKLIDRKLRIGMFPNHARLFAAPRRIAVGDHGSPEEIAAELRAAGYSESGGNAMGSFRLGMNWIEILPGSGSYFQPEEGLIEFEGGRIARISSTRDRVARGEYLLEPRLITNLFDRSREKRRMLKLADFPQVLKDAILSAEDKRFFEHHGLDPFGMVRAVYVDLRSGRKEQGASTLTQQLARSFFLDQRKTWRRKLPEMMITLALEQKLTKDEIFEDYCNQMYLGRRGSFSIHGFGEAAQAYFGKDIRRVSLAEAAMLAGILPNANYYNPFRAPQRVKERRDRVLSLMRQNGKISEAEYAQAVATPLHLQPGASQALEAPYFVDMVTDTLQSQLQDMDFLSHPYRVYTTLDLDLQRAAVDAIRTGMEEVDKQLRRQRRFRDTSFPPAQCALIA
ncbi:MAG TPA: transglycosylase domain-containing protein, partial [Bryobacteraceae bacterium]|nr:transglycosylase domain-containing protein [Bryobacteraceae bacterium]